MLKPIFSLSFSVRINLIEEKTNSFALCTVKIFILSFFFEERTGAQENQMKFLKRSNYFFSTSFVHAESSSDVVQQVYMYMRNEKERKKTHFYWNAYHNGSSRQNSTLSGYLNSTSIHKILRIFFFILSRASCLSVYA